LLFRKRKKNKKLHRNRFFFLILDI
jgi:hypothetical protein